MKCKSKSLDKLIRKKFGVIKELGHGGQGKVYLVKTLLDNKEYALKLIDKTSEESFKRFRKEVTSLKSIKSNYVIKIISENITDKDNENYYVMELARYGTLQDHNYYINDVETSLKLFKKICLGVKAAHDKGILHRDLKPKNILLVNDERDVKVSDFGLSYELDKTDEEITKIREKVGTNYFSSPEQTSLPPNPTKRSDIFSLGKILFYMITGNKSADFDEKLSIDSFVNHKYSDKIDVLINKMSSFEPKNRYEDIDEVIKAIDKLLIKPKYFRFFLRG